MEKITSAQNPKIKYLLELQTKSKERRQSGLFVVEGVREIEHCIASGYELHSLFICPEILNSEIDIFRSLAGSFARNSASPRPLPSALGPLPLPVSGGGHVLSNDLPAALKASVFEVSRQVYEKVAYREGTEGVIAEFKAKSHSLSDLNLGENPVIMVLESVEKPGNLGAVLRSADAAGADAVLICDPLTDIYNPNLIRASIGAVFTVQVAACTSEEAIAFLKERNFKILTAQLQDSDLYYDSDMTGPTAIVMGTESVGLSDTWRIAASAHIRIPMLGRLDSLNVSVSAAILLFEAIRQRQK